MASGLAVPDLSASFSKRLGLNIVQITIGPEFAMKKFAIHKDLLCGKVPYFNSMFNGGYMETTTLTAHLPDDDYEAFELFFEWVYTGKIGLPKDIEKASPIPTFIHLFAFAEKYNIGFLADHTMDSLTGILNQRDWLPTPRDMELAYELTHEKSKMRMFMVRMFAYIVFFFEEDDENTTWNKNKMAPLMQSCPDLCADHFSLMREHGVPQSDPRNIDACEYHQHPADQDCPSESHGTASASIKLVFKKPGTIKTYGKKGVSPKRKR